MIQMILGPVFCFFLFADSSFAQTEDVLFEDALFEDALFEVSVNKYLMGTKVETTARHKDIIACKKALFLAYQEMERVEGLLSSQLANSEISRLNRAAGMRPVRVSQETFEILARAKAYARRFDGLFDITIGPISVLWGFNNSDEVNIPKRQDIEARLKLVDYQTVDLDSSNTTVFFKVKGTQIDLGGIAKGYAIDRGAAVLKQQGVRHFLLNAGGDLYVSGQKDAQTDWRVGIKHPREAGDLIARFGLKDLAVATSGDYERYRLIDGRRYHHILDPRTGYPGTLSQSATVLSGSAEEADVLATYLFLLGYQQAVQKQDLNFPFLIVGSDGVGHYNEAFSQLGDVEVWGPDR